jgi:hypothetical protein
MAHSTSEQRAAFLQEVRRTFETWIDALRARCTEQPRLEARESAMLAVKRAVALEFKERHEVVVT